MSTDNRSSKERLLQAIETGLQAMRDCQRNAHGGKVCFDGDEWHERWAILSEARRTLRGAVETSAWSLLDRYATWAEHKADCTESADAPCSCGLTELEIEEARLRGAVEPSEYCSSCGVLLGQRQAIVPHKPDCTHPLVVDARRRVKATEGPSNVK